jgi:hypothetical protein
MMVAGWGCDTCVGSLIIDVHNDTLRGKFYSSAGVVKDQFSIFKDLTVAHDPLSEQNKSLKIWPNPFSDQLELEIELSENSRLFATILDISGQEVWNEKLGKFGIGKHQMVLKNLPTHLVSGTYILRIDNGIDSWTQRIVKQQ